MFDCLRANKATMAHGLEVRVPFLDKAMIDETMMLDGDYKLRKLGESTQFVEKWLLREAFNTPETPYLPDEVLWRQKEQCSDGVGYDWIDGLKAHAEKVISDENMATAARSHPRGALQSARFSTASSRTSASRTLARTASTATGQGMACCSTAKKPSSGADRGTSPRPQQSGRFRGQPRRSRFPVSACSLGNILASS